MKKRDQIDRFAEKVVVESDCWLWTASKDGRGVGLFHGRRGPSALTGGPISISVAEG